MKSAYRFIIFCLSFLSLSALASGFITLSHAQETEPFSFTNEVRVYQEDFNAYAGSEATIPAHMFVTWDFDRLSDPFTGIGDFNSSDPETAYGNFTAYTSDSEDFSFGIRERAPGDLRDARLFFAFTNNTDEPISVFAISYDIEAWYIGDRRNRIRLKYDNVLESDNRATFEVDLISTDNPSDIQTPDFKVNGALDNNRVRIEELIDITLVDDGTGSNFEALQPGETGYFRFQFSNTDGDEGSLRSGLAINNFEVRISDEDVPEPVQPEFAFTNEVTTYSQNFNDYRGSEETLDEFLFVTWDEGRVVNPFNGVGDFNTTDAEEGYGNFVAYTSGGDGYSFGIRERAPLDLRDARLFFVFTNETDEPITTFNVQYDVEAWFIGDRRNRLRLKYDTVLNSDERPVFEEDIFSTDNPSSVTTPGVKVDGSMDDNRTSVGGLVDITTIVKDPETGETFGPLMPGETAYFRWQFSNTDGDEGDLRSGLAINNLVISTDTDGTSIEDPVDIARGIELDQNYPNPFNPTTQIRFTLPESAQVSLEVYNMTGQRVATLIGSENRSAGSHTISFDATNLSSGVYIYQLRTAETSISRKMLLVK